MNRRNLLVMSGSVAFGSVVASNTFKESVLAVNINLTGVDVPKNKLDSDNLELDFSKFSIITENLNVKKNIDITISSKIENQDYKELYSQSINIEDKTGTIYPDIDSVELSKLTIPDELKEEGNTFDVGFKIIINHEDVDKTLKEYDVEITVIESDLQIDDFSSYNLDKFPSNYIIEDDSVEDNMYIDNTYSLSGDKSLRFGDTGSGSHDFGEIDNEFKTFMVGEYTSSKPSQITMSYYETNDSNGQWVRWMKDNKELCSVGTTNAELEIVTGNGEQRLADNDNISPTYDAWRTYTITIDWENKTLDLLWEDIDGSTTSIEENNLSFKNEDIDEINRIEFGRDQRVNDNGSGDMDCWYDNISFKPD